MFDIIVTSRKELDGYGASEPEGKLETTNHSNSIIMLVVTPTKTKERLSTICAHG